MSAKLLRYWVSPHLGRNGVVTLRGWDVRKVLVNEEGCELDGGVAGTYDTKAEAKQGLAQMVSATDGQRYRPAKPKTKERVMRIKTYRGRTAGGILRTAVLSQTKDGAWHVVVQPPQCEDTHICEACMTESDEMVLATINGPLACMSLSGTAARKLRRLEREADRRMLKESE